MGIYKGIYQFLYLSFQMHCLLEPSIGGPLQSIISKPPPLDLKPARRTLRSPNSPLWKESLVDSPLDVPG